MQIQNLGGGGGGGKQPAISKLPNPQFQSEANSKSLICTPFFFFCFHANKSDFLEKGFTLRGLGSKLKDFATRKWPQLYIQLRQSFCRTLFKRDKAFGFHVYLGRIECLMIRRCNMPGGSTFFSVNH